MGPLHTEYIMIQPVMTLYHYILQLFDHQPSVNSQCSHQNNINNSDRWSGQYEVSILSMMDVTELLHMVTGQQFLKWLQEPGATSL